MALTIWDQRLGASREATQVDLDVAQAKIDAFGRLVTAFNEIGDDLLVRVNTIVRQAEQSASLSGDLNE